MALLPLPPRADLQSSSRWVVSTAEDLGGKSNHIHDLSERWDDGRGNTILRGRGAGRPTTSILVRATEGGDGTPVLTSIWHEGAVVHSGQKYVLRTDVMYKADQ